MAYYCKVCRKPISERVYNYSINHFGRALCFTHQRENKPQQLSCSFCKQKISLKVYDYSNSHFGLPLCWEHQKNASKIEAKNLLCSFCKIKISEKVYDYSTREFGKPLCMVHQKTAVKTTPKRPKSNAQKSVGRRCSDCNKAITIAVYEFSMKNFGLPLCRNCQPYTERRKRSRGNSAPPKRKLQRGSRIAVGGTLPKEKRYYNGY